MDFAELSQILFDGLCPRLTEHSGAALMAAERCRLDDWLAVEAFGVLVQAGLKPDVEKEKMDVACGPWGLLVRTLVTNIPCDQAQNKNRPIKKSIEGTVKEIWKLTTPGQTAFKHRAMLLAAYPTTHDNERWQSLHLRQIAGELTRLEHRPFQFWGDIPGVLYLGLCTEE